MKNLDFNLNAHINALRTAGNASRNFLSAIVADIDDALVSGISDKIILGAISALKDSALKGVPKTAIAEQTNAVNNQLKGARVYVSQWVKFKKAGANMDVFAKASPSWAKNHGKNSEKVKAKFGKVVAEKLGLTETVADATVADATVADAPDKAPDSVADANGGDNLRQASLAWAQAYLEVSARVDMDSQKKLTLMLKMATKHAQDVITAG